MHSQINEITFMNLRNLPSRFGLSSVIVVGIAGVVAVLVGLLSMAAGFTSALESAGSADRAIVLREATNNELSSIMSMDARRTIGAMEGVAASTGELYLVTAIDKKATGTTANVVIRGVEAESFTIRPEVKIVAGRNFDTGKSEVIAGIKAVDQFANLEVGDEIIMRNQPWTVVGHFEADGSSYEGEMWSDLVSTQAAFRSGGGVSTMRLQLDSPEDAERLDLQLQDDPRFQVSVISEKEHYATQAQDRADIINSFGLGVGAIMAIGAFFAALNTMYSAVSARTVEIATLRALGFGSVPVVISVMIEAVVLALLGGTIGGLLVWFIFDGYTASTLNNVSFSQVAFDFAVTPELLQLGLTWALVLGVIGGLFPAVRAARLPITTALRGE
jgi:putative ABC transport system permease protein